MSSRLLRVIVLAFALAVLGFASPASASTQGRDDCVKKCVEYAKKKCDDKYGKDFKKCFWERFRECKKYLDCDKYDRDCDKEHGDKRKCDDDCKKYDCDDDGDDDCDEDGLRARRRGLRRGLRARRRRRKKDCDHGDDDCKKYD